MSVDLLKTAILDLVTDLRPKKYIPVIAGGLGLYLKQLEYQKHNEQSLIKGRNWPEPRATEDVDILLETEIVADAEAMIAIRQVLDSQGYRAITPNLQFVKDFGLQQVRIDLLTGPIEKQYVDLIHVNGWRARPNRDDVKLHARLTPETIAFHVGSISLTLDGQLSSGINAKCKIIVPGPFTLLLMKVHAYADRLEITQSARQDNNEVRAVEEEHAVEKHVLDIYRIVAMMTRSEFTKTREQFVEYEENKHVLRASRTIREDFDGRDAIGVYWLEKAALRYGPRRLKLDIPGFMKGIAELLT